MLVGSVSDATISTIYVPSCRSGERQRTWAATWRSRSRCLAFLHTGTESASCSIGFSKLNGPAHRYLCLRFKRLLTASPARLEARMDSLLLSCRALSSPTTCRFIPALSGLPTVRELSRAARIDTLNGSLVRMARLRLVGLLPSSSLVRNSPERSEYPCDLFELVRNYKFRSVTNDIFQIAECASLVESHHTCWWTLTIIVCLTASPALGHPG